MKTIKLSSVKITNYVMELNNKKQFPDKKINYE